MGSLSLGLLVWINIHTYYYYAREDMSSTRKQDLSQYFVHGPSASPGEALVALPAL